MVDIRIPNLNSYGNSFGHSYGISPFNTVTRGDVKTSELNKKNQADEIEFTQFEKDIRDFALAQLGEPVVRVELTDFQVKTCIDSAVTKLYYHCPLWMKQYACFTASAGVNVYELPTFILDNVEYVGYKKAYFGVPFNAGTLEMDYFIKYFSSNFAFGMDFTVGEFYLMQSHLELVKRILGAEGGWEVINGKYLQLYPTPTFNNEEVIVEFRGIDSNTIHPAYKNWLQRYTTVLLKAPLAQIRGKYQILPSPGGGAKLNADDLLRQYAEEKQLLEQELMDEIEEIPIPQWM